MWKVCYEKLQHAELQKEKFKYIQYLTVDELKKQPTHKPQCMSNVMVNVIGFLQEPKKSESLTLSNHFFRNKLL